MNKLNKVLALATLALVPASKAAISVIDILDAGTFSSYTADDAYETSSSTGFFGMYNTVAAGEPQLAHLFGIESTDYSRTIAQIDIGFLNGATILSATLSFNLVDGSAGTQDVQLTGFDSGGTLAYLWDAPGVNIDQDLFSVTGAGANALDVTALVQAAASGNVDWLGVHLQGTSEYQWTYTGTGGSADNADYTLTVEYGDPVPEPSTVIGGLALGALALRRVIRRK